MDLACIAAAAAQRSIGRKEGVCVCVCVCIWVGGQAGGCTHVCGVCVFVCGRVAE